MVVGDCCACIVWCCYQILLGIICQILVGILCQVSGVLGGLWFRWKGGFRELKEFLLVQGVYLCWHEGDWWR